jgi:ABC-2 type transport system ATP-binding protein
MNALDIKNVTVRNGEFWLRDISFEVPKGSIVGLVGRNGAGKTTLINTIANCLERESGTILYDGLTYWDHEIEVKRKLGIVFDKIHMNNKYTPERFKKVLSKSFTYFDKDFFDSYVEKFQLPYEKTIDKFSSGMQHKFMLIAVMSMRPEILILDEPTNGVDPADRYEMVDLFQNFMEDEQHAILFSTHITSDLDKIADYLVFIDQGRMVISGEKNELLETFRKVQIPVSLMTDKIKSQVYGLRSTALYYEGICNKPEIWNMEGVTASISNVEDLAVNISEIHKKGGIK